MSYAEPERYQARAEEIERDAELRHRRIAAAEGEHIAEPAHPTMAAIRKTAATVYQRTSNLLSMHATHDRYARDPRRAGDYRRQAAAITAREAELQAIATPAEWRRYLTDRDGQRDARTARQAAADQPGRQPESQAEPACLSSANKHLPVVELRRPAPTIPAPSAEPIRCSAAGCSSLATHRVLSDRPLCGFHAAQLAARSQAAAAPPAPAIARPKKAKPTPPAPAIAPDLAATMRELLAAHTLGDVLDAAWDVGRAMHPRPSMEAR